MVQSITSDNKNTQELQQLQMAENVCLTTATPPAQITTQITPKSSCASRDFLSVSLQQKTEKRFGQREGMGYMGGGCLSLYQLY